jgi:hypothetical protein
MLDVLIGGILYACNTEWKEIQNLYFFQLPLALSKLHIATIITSNLYENCRERANLVGSLSSH